MPPWASTLKVFAQQQVGRYIRELMSFLAAQGCRVPPWHRTQIAADAVHRAEQRVAYVVLREDTAYLESLRDAKDILGTAAAGYTGNTDPSIQVLGWCYKLELVRLGQGSASGQTYNLFLASDLNRLLMAWFWRKLAKPHRSQAYMLVLDVWSRLWESMMRCCYRCDRPVDRYVFGIANFVLLAFLKQVNPGPQSYAPQAALGAVPAVPPHWAQLRQMALHLIEGLPELAANHHKWYRAALLYFLTFGVKHIALINGVKKGPATRQEQLGRKRLDQYLHRRGWRDPSEREALFIYLHQCGFQGLWPFLFPGLPGRIATPPSPASCAGEKANVLDAYASLGRDEFVVLFCATTGLDQASIAHLIGTHPLTVASRLSSGRSNAASWMQGQGWPNAANRFQYITDYGLDRYLE